MFYTDAILNPKDKKLDAEYYNDPYVDSPPGGPINEGGPLRNRGLGNDPSSGGAFDWGSSLSPNGQPITPGSVPAGSGGAPMAGPPSMTPAAPTPGIPGGAPASGAGSSYPRVLSNIAGQPIGSKDPILPGVVPPISPGLQDAFMQYMQSQVGQGVAKYPGQLSPDPKDTIMPMVTGSWTPWNGAMIDMSNRIQTGYDPLNQLMAHGMPTADAVNPMQQFLQGAAGSGYQTPTSVGNIRR